MNDSHNSLPHPTANKRTAEKDMDHSFHFSLTKGAQCSIVVRLSHEGTYPGSNWKGLPSYPPHQQFESIFKFCVPPLNFLEDPLFNVIESQSFRTMDEDGKSQMGVLIKGVMDV